MGFTTWSCYLYLKSKFEFYFTMQSHENIPGYESSKRHAGKGSSCYCKYSSAVYLWNKVSCWSSNEQHLNAFLLLHCFLVALQTWVTPCLFASSSLSLESDFFFFLILNKHMSSSHRTESYSNLTWPIYIALNIGLELTSSVKNEEVYSHSICVHCCCLLTCELLRLSCHVAVPTMVPGHLTSCWEQILFVTPNLSEMKPREMLRNWLFNPQKLCLFDVNGLKRF